MKFWRYMGFGQVRNRWRHSLEFRLLLGLSTGVVLLSLLGSCFFVLRQGTLIHQEAEGRAKAFARTFAVMGSTVVIDNLFRIQEAMAQYLTDPEILEIDVIDPDGMIVAAKHSDRIGTIVTGWNGDFRSANTTEHLTYGREASGVPFILVTEPLNDSDQPTAWIQVKYSLVHARREQQQMAGWLVGVSLVMIVIIMAAMYMTIQRILHILQGAVATLQCTLASWGGDRVMLLQQQDLTISGEGKIESFSRVIAWTNNALRTQAEHLHSLNVSLEQRVCERTRQLEAALQDAHRLADDAQAASRAKSQFLANMSHEIRTPMNGVLGMAELLLASMQDDRQRHLTETIQRSGETLLAVINDILDFSKIEAGKLKLEQLDFDVQETVEDAVELFAVPAQHKGVELTCHLSGAIPYALRGDPVRLRQALLNLLSNAVKFTAQGTIQVGVEAVAETAEAVTLRFTVKDSGIGIPVEVQARVFEAFAQADGSTTRRFGGTGLGLAIVKELVALMQGQIGVESQPGVGSTFWFTAVLQRQVGAARSVPDRAPSLATQKILAVDDTATNREILEHHLRSWGATAVLVASGREALAALQAAVDGGQPFDLAILDLHMPDMDGLMLAQAIRADPRVAGLRLLMLTSVGYDATGPDAPVVDSWVTKPIRKNLLYQALCGLSHRDPQIQPLRKVEPQPLGSPVQTQAAHILLVEDTPVNREVATSMLELLGHRVAIAENGQAAVEAVARTSYDLVLMDCQMPIMDGFAATGAIRQQEQAAGSRRRQPIIALTAHALEGDRDRCLAAGMDDYLTKPFTLQSLRDMLAQWIPVAGRTTQPATTVPSDLPREPDCSTAPTRAVIDKTAWEAIRSLQRPDRPNVLHKTLALYLAHSQALIEQLQQASATQDLRSVQATAHTMKSSSAQLGAHHLAELCQEVEAAARTGTPDPLQALIPLLVGEHRDVCAAMRQALPALQQQEAA